MRRSTSFAAVGAAALMLTGCATTVAGNPVADMNALKAMLDTGSFSTSKRTIDPPTEAQARALEARRMLEIVPLGTEIDPSLKWTNGVASATAVGMKMGFGSGIGNALSGMQLGITVDVKDQSPSQTGLPKKDLYTAVVRMRSDADATSAVADPRVMATDDPQFGVTQPPKVPVPVSTAGAKAFTQTSSDSSQTMAVLAHGRFVIVVYTRGLKTAAVDDFLGRQVKALDGFTPTADDKLTSLPVDRDGVGALTLAPERASFDTYGWSTARGLVAAQTSITDGQKDFADAGVDVIGVGGNNVYRAKDAAGAKLLADRFITESKSYYTGATEYNVGGVPGARCVTWKTVLRTTNYCVVPVGRYMAEYGAIQQAEAKQATSAAYLILSKA
ncbi:hypothetical protein P0W64_03570 [Tsukamurella sp. 8F]|uniref:DUF7373 family lipoprotein n=1 Tax=unclassified Tsukamurella TaxID=2633480 RepID=UPI0023BA0572|nr:MULTISPECIES: hypothetical protein [unclassified Tsukamurella]MDF0529461.1 hypothetical protein [Tsukamurella sp. 8J]MDF0585851.1 hypothetical protein [Tsukamurella sp. 8F]